MAEGRLTLRMAGVGHNVPFAPLLSAGDSVLSILKEVTSDADDIGQVEWAISAATMSSPLTLTVEAEAGAPDSAHMAVGRSLAGLMAIEEEPDVPPYFNDHALNRAKALGRCVGGGVAWIELSANGFSVRPSSRTVAHVDQILQYSESHTTFEGVIESVTVHEVRRFNIYDNLRGRRIECYFSSDLLQQVREQFGRRVQVYGVGRFDRAGEPVSMRVEELIARRPKEELPQFSDLEGINFTNGVNPTEYVRGLRDE